MYKKRSISRRCKCRGRRGSTLVESVLVIVAVSLLFWYLFLIADLAMIKIVGQHSAFVMGRSHTVGFNSDITRRAARVGAIPISGNLEFPTMEQLGINSNIQLGMWDPHLISAYIQEQPIAFQGGNGEVMRYQHWDKLRLDRPTQDLSEQDTAHFATTFVIDFDKGDYASGANDYMNNQAPERHRISLIPGIWWFYKGGQLKIQSDSPGHRFTMMNHAGYYLE